MALVLGTNCGFVSVAPTTDPDGWNSVVDDYATALKHTSPATAAKITEIGWYCNNATEESNFEVGIYTHDAGNDEPETVVGIDTTNAKGTGAGWKVVTGLNIAISAETIYWIALQVDDTATNTGGDYIPFGGTGWIRTTSGKTALPNPTWDIGGSGDSGGLFGIYAVWEAAAEGTNIKINIGDTFKDVSEMKINIGDTWKAVAEVKQNIGDTWKTVF